MILRLVESWIRCGPPSTPQVRTSFIRLIIYLFKENIESVHNELYKTWWFCYVKVLEPLLLIVLEAVHTGEDYPVLMSLHLSILSRLILISHSLFSQLCQTAGTLVNSNHNDVAGKVCPMVFSFINIVLFVYSCELFARFRIFLFILLFIKISIYHSIRQSSS